MLNSNFAFTTPTAGLVPSWQGMTFAERIATVIERFVDRAGEDATVSYDDFEHAEETCDLGRLDIDTHIGAAKRLVTQRAARCEASYDREARVRQGALQVLDIFPDQQLVFDCLRNNGFDSFELGNLWTDIMVRAGQTVATLKQPRPGAVNLVDAMHLERARTVMADFTAPVQS